MLLIVITQCFSLLVEQNVILLDNVKWAPPGVEQAA